MTLAEFKRSVQYPLRQATLCFLVKDNQLLLAMKKRGFGKGRWNGAGGKPSPGESIEQTAIRETQEEIGVTPRSLRKRAVLNFYFPHQPDWNQQVIVYWANEWEGEPHETEEMRPQWFPLGALPYDSMWPTDAYWLPKVIAGAIVNGEFLFGEGDRVLDSAVLEVQHEEA